MNDSKTRIWVALFVAMVFICGLSMGLALGVWFAPRTGPDRAEGPFRPGGPPGRRGFVSERILNRLADDPAFTEDQRERLLTLFADRETRFRELNLDMRRRFEAERESLREEIGTILTPGQMEIFDAFSRRRRERRPGGPRELRGDRIRPE